MASTAAWINVGGVTSIGTATIAVDGTVTLTGHGLTDGDLVVFDALTGGADGPLVAGAIYYVRDATTDAFQVSGSRGGVIVELATAGGGDVYTATPAYSAETLRQLASHLMFHGSTNRLGARQGVRPGAGDPVSVSGLTWTVETHTGTVEPANTSTQGPYTYVQLADTGTLNPADTSDRIDALDLQVQDDDADASGFRRTRIVYTAGTPSGTPTAPPVTDGAVRLATITVASSGTTAVDELAEWTVASGGVLPIRDDSERPSAPYDMMLTGRQDTGEVEVWHDGAWGAVAAPGSVELYNEEDPGFPVVTGATTTEVVFNRITIPAVSYARLLTVTASAMLQCSTTQPYDARLYVGAVRIDIHRSQWSDTGVFRTSPLHGSAILAADTVGVVEYRHVRAGSTGTVTPSVGSGSYYMSIAAHRMF